MYANQTKKSDLYYVKGGLVHTPTVDDSLILPNFGLGARFQRNYYGFELSANLSSLLFVNYASLKGLFLFYPLPERRNQFFFGMGPGVGYDLTVVPMGAPFGSAVTENVNMALEGVVGYEFRHARHFKTFIQLELSQPTFVFGRNREYFKYTPGLALTAGLGF